MKTILLLIFYPSKGLELLDEKYEDDLFRNSLVIFVVFGFVTFVSGFDFEEERKFLLTLVFLFLAIAFWIIFDLLMSALVYGLGKLLKGKASYVEVCSLYAYAKIPLILLFILTLFLNNRHHFSIEDSGKELVLWTKVTLVVFPAISLYILIRGLAKFNGYSYALTKAFINALPLVAITAVFWYDLLVF